MTRSPRKSPAAGRILFAGLLLVLLAPNAAGFEQGRLVAVGDIHGAYDDFARILQRAGIVDEQLRWSAGSATLVQTGDFLDRGLQEVEVMDFLMELEKDADRAGGRAVVLLGNHEIMNLTLDLRYIAEEGFEAFVDNKSEQRRDRAYRDYTRFLERRAKRRGEDKPKFDDEHRAAWMAKHPPGLLERLESLDDGRYGRWLRKHGVVTRLGRSMFVHGGIHPQLAELSADDINRRVRDELQAYGRLREALVKLDVILPFFTFTEAHDAVDVEIKRLEVDPESDPQMLEILKAFAGTAGWFILHRDGPVWYREYARWEETPEADLLLETLKTGLDVDRFIVGHTPMLQKGIQSRFEGAIFLIDTGMLSWYYEGGQASALELGPGGATAIYLDRREAIWPLPKQSTMRAP